MPTEVFYYRDEQGKSDVQEFLDHVEPKEMARSLAQLDLLEGEDLPAEVDKAGHEPHAEAAPEEGVAEKNGASHGTPSKTQVRILSARIGRERFRFAYVRHTGQTIVIAASPGKQSKAQRRTVRDAIERAVEEIRTSHFASAERLKSHREYVAEMTLSDPTLAALYSRAREHAQFAVAVIRLRDSAGFTADSLAERTGLSRARVESLQRGRMPRLGTMRRLVDAMQARIVIAPGVGVTIEPHFPAQPVKRPSRSRKNGADAPAPSLTISEVS